MSNTQTDEYSEDAEAEQNTPNFRRQLEKRAREAETRAQELEAKLTTYEKQSVFQAAGLDPSNKLHAMAMKAYDGELSADAVRAFAEDNGVLTTQEPSAQQDQLSTFARIDRASLDAQPVAPVGTTEDFMNRIINAGTQEEKWAAIQAAGLDAKG